MHFGVVGLGSHKIGWWFFFGFWLVFAEFFVVGVFLGNSFCFRLHLVWSFYRLAASYLPFSKEGGGFGFERVPAVVSVGGAGLPRRVLSGVEWSLSGLFVRPNKETFRWLIR